MGFGGFPDSHHQNKLSPGKSVHYKAWFIHFTNYDVAATLLLTINN